ncbi:hypothetical protein [uncultured Helicobacter sp.]
MILGTFLQAIATIASMLFNLYIWILIITLIQILYKFAKAYNA